MGESLLVLIREGFEASLIVGIVFGYLRKIDRRDLDRPVWAGVGLAALLATLFGVILHNTVGGFEGDARLRAFAAISFVAAGVLTWMVFWMRRQSRAIKGELEHRVDAALASDRVRTGVLLVAFFAVLREGIETALFLIAAATSSTGWDVFVGGLIGLAIAALLGYLVYTGSKVLPMRLFFNLTGMIVIVFAAGLLAKGVMFLQLTEYDALDTLDAAVYDLTGFAWLTVQTQSGRFLAGRFGWDPRTSLEQVVVWLAYLVPVTYLFLRRDREQPAGPEAPATSDEPEDLAAAALAAEA
ncbi:MAG TPA: FTR1 family protein [Acidimicrobiales bacterium]|nr:FTR1 family protein [Acidimicrobiales bacterium]